MKEYEDYIREHLVERGWDTLRPGDVAKSICIESGELLEIFQWSNPTLTDVKNNPEKVEKIKKELADVLNYSFDLSVIMGFDTETICREKLERVKAKYPPNLYKNSGYEPGNEPEYHQAKQEHRQKGEQ